MDAKRTRACLMHGVLMLLCSVAPATAQVSVGIGLPNVSIGINLPLFPELAPVPGYPVYYAPRLDSNYFFYDGMYWVYQDDRWYASSWYNGPWGLVGPEVVPVYLLRVPVRYYRLPPPYFHGWRADAPPHWGEHWGKDWEHQRAGWNRWNHKSTPRPAPLPVYQRHYAGDRYPQVEQQQALQAQHYHYQPHDTMVRQHTAHHGGPQPQQAPQQGAAQHPHEKQHQPQQGVAQQQQDPQQGKSHKQKAGPQDQGAPEGAKNGHGGGEQ